MQRIAPRQARTAAPLGYEHLHCVVDDHSRCRNERGRGQFDRTRGVSHARATDELRLDRRSRTPARISLVCHRC